MKKGQRLSLKNFYLKRPGNGDFNIKNYKKLLNKKVKRDIKKYSNKIEGCIYMKKIIVLTSTRADFGKMKSLIHSLRKNKKI